MFVQCTEDHKLARVPCKASLDKEASVSRVIFVQSAMCGMDPEHAAVNDSLQGAKTEKVSPGSFQF